jgi:serine/threonine protein kinase
MGSAADRDEGPSLADVAARRGFEIEGRLGEGGSGIVYLAVERRRGSRVALKTLREPDAHGLLHFKNEFRSIRDLSHPNLVSLYELFEGEGHFFFTMELVPGVDLLTWIRGQAPSVERTMTLDLPAPGENAGQGLVARASVPLDTTRLRDAMAQLARGLLALHGAGKVHRDVKPTNTRVTPEGRVVLLDFGLVEDADCIRRTRNAGTVAYMAPEQADSGPAGPAADWYAMGAVLYEALTGQPPYLGPATQVMAQKRLGAPVAPSRIVGGVPPDLDALCLDLLRGDPRARPSGAEVMDRLAPRPARPAPTQAAADTRPGDAPTRQHALLELEHALGEARNGKSITVLIRGEERTRPHALLDEFCETVRTRGDVLLLRSRCDEREFVPYRAVDALVDALTTQVRAEGAGLPGPADVALLARVFPVVAQLGRAPPTGTHDPEMPSRELRRRIFDELRDWLKRVAEERILVLAVEDLQWADAEGVAVLAHALGPAGPRRALLVASERIEPSARSAQISHPLGDVRELRLHQDARLCSGASSEAETDDATRGRLEGLGPDAARTLELLAVAVGPVTPRVVSETLDVSETSVEAALELLCKAHLVRLTSRRGEKVATLAERRLERLVLAPGAATRAGLLSTRLSRTLEAMGADPELTAAQWQRAGDVEGAGRMALRAAQGADAGLAFERAVRLWATARDQTADPAERLRRSIGYAAALANAGRLVDAAGEYATAAGGTGPDEALDLRRRAAELYLTAGRLERGLESLRSVLASIGVKMPRTPWGAAMGLLARRLVLLVRGLSFRSRPASEVPARTLLRIDICRSVALGLGFVDNIRAAYFQSVHTLAALRAGEPSRIAHAFAMEAPFVAALGRRGGRKSRQLVGRAEALAARGDDPHLRAMARFAAGFSALQQGQWRRALPPLDQARELFAQRCGGLSWELCTAQMASLWALFYLGELAELARRGNALRRDADDNANAYASVNLRLGLPNVAWLLHDDVAGAHEAVDHAMAEWQEQTTFGAQDCFALVARTHADLYAGKAESAHRRLRAAWPALRRSMFLQNHLIRVTMLNLRACCALGCAGEANEDGRRFAAEAERDGRRLARERMPWSDALAELVQASVAEARGRMADASDGYAAAVVAFEGADMPLHAAAALFRRAAVVGSRGARIESEALGRVEAQGTARPDRLLAMLAPGRVR